MSVSVTSNYSNSNVDKYSLTSSTSNQTNTYLFDVDETTNMTEEEKSLRSQLALLEAELQVLQAQRQAKVQYKKSLEMRKAEIERQKAAIEAQIRANESVIKQNNEIIKQNEEKIQLTQKEIEELQKEYDVKNAEALVINERINERVAQLIKGSQEDLEAQTEKIKNATDEAYAKVASGEITEDEVADYVSKKVGNHVVGSNADFAAIYAMNQQLRSLTENSRSISNQMVAKSSMISVYQADISSALLSNKEIATANEPLNQQINQLNAQITNIDGQIANVDTQIAQYDVKINNKKSQIAEVKSQLDGSYVNDFSNTNYNTIINNENKNNYNSSVHGTTEVDSTNPFLAVSYDQGSFINMVETLDAMYKANEQNIVNAEAIVEQNKEQMKNLFTFA